MTSLGNNTFDPDDAVQSSIVIISFVSLYGVHGVSFDLNRRWADLGVPRGRDAGVLGERVGA